MITLQPRHSASERSGLLSKKAMSLLRRSEYGQVATAEDSTNISHHAEVALAPPSRPPPSASYLASMRESQEQAKVALPPPSKARPSPEAIAALRREAAGQAEGPTSARAPPRDDSGPARPSPPSSQRPTGMLSGATSWRQQQSQQREEEERPTGGVVVSERFHAQVGGNVSRVALEDMASRLISEARTQFHQRKFEDALVTFQQALAVAEKTCGKGKHSEYGAIMHNVGSCLHCLGQFEEAKVHYEQALLAFQRDPPSRLYAAVWGDPDKRRQDFVRERLIDIQFGRKPDLDKYLDGSGRKREVTPDLAEPPKPRDPFNHQAAIAAAYGAHSIGVGHLGGYDTGRSHS